VKANGHGLAGDNHCTSAPTIAKKDLKNAGEGIKSITNKRKNTTLST
jgi:hypothetical protein